MPDPERSTALLWEGRSRPGLTLERIVRAAVELADAEGLDAVTMRAVAERLGFTTMSLYRHVPGKAELVDLMHDEVLGETGGGASEEEEAGPPWRRELVEWAREALAVRRRHPWLVGSASARRVPGPNGVAAFERALAVVAPAGFEPAQVVAVVTLVGGFVESAARQVVEAEREERRSGVGADEWWGARDSLYQHLDRYPTLSRLYRDGAYDVPVDPFEFGLARVLDGVAALLPAGRDAERDAMRDEKSCRMCGGPVAPGTRGRPREYCSPACRQRAHRRRTG